MVKNFNYFKLNTFSEFTTSKTQIKFSESYYQVRANALSEFI